MADIKVGDKVYIEHPDLVRTAKNDIYIVEKVKSNQGPYWALTSVRAGKLAIIDIGVIFVVVPP